MISIAPATHDQVAEIQRVAGVIWRAHYPGIITPAQIDYMLARGYAGDALDALIDTPGRGLLVASDASGIVGLGAWYLAVDPVLAKLDKLYVLPSHQRLGVGRMLIEWVSDEARAAGAGTLILNVNKRNVNAIAAYLKHGFAVREAVVNDIGNGFVMDDYVMAKPLR